MKIRLLLAALVLVAAPVWAQPDPIIKPPNGLPFPLVTPAEAEKLAILQPLKLHLKNVTVAAALEELQTQSGIELDLEEVNYSKKTLAKKFSIDLETRSFNAAFDAIMDAAKIKGRLQRYDTNRPWRVDFNRQYGDYGDSADAPQFKQGLFGVRLTSLNTVLSKTVDLSDAKLPQRTEQNQLTLNLMMQPDLRLPLVGTVRPRLTRAQDDQGRSLLLETDENNGRNNVYSFYNNGYNQGQTQLNLRAPAPDAKTLAHLEGVVVYPIVTKTETWEIADLMGQPEWTHAFESGEAKYDMTIKATLPAKGEGAGQVRLEIAVTSNQRATPEEVPGPMLASAPVLAGLTIVDANGVKMRVNQGNSSSDTNAGKMTTSATLYPTDQNQYDEDGNPKPKPLALPLKLTFVAPLSVVQTEAPFSFENVALP